mgnify:FL=1
MLTHVVLFKLKDRRPETIQKTKEVLMGMEGKIPMLLSIEVGVDVLRSERSYDIVLITKFHSLQDMLAYQEHPVHQEVLRYMNEVRESSVCVDFES